MVKSVKKIRRRVESRSYDWQQIDESYDSYEAMMDEVEIFFG